jgi:hypothetical protein
MNRRNNTQNNPINSGRRNVQRNQRQRQRQRRNISSRRNRRIGAFTLRRNRLARAQYASRNNNRNNQKRRRRLVFARRTRMNLKLRKIFVGGLHKSINNRKLFNLFRQEGRILGWKVFYDRNGYSRGFGVLEFDRPRDAWKTIQRWNNSSYMGLKLRIEYKKNINRNKGNYRNVNSRGFNYGRNNYLNGIRNVNNNNNFNGNRNKYYYY